MHNISERGKTMRRLFSGPMVRRLGSSLVSFSVVALAIWLIAPLLLLADSASSNQRKVTNLAQGVYLIQHKDAPDHFPQGNTVVIIGDGGVLVVDSCYLPSSAREDIVQNSPVDG
jgi:hypothetical protein